MSSDGSNNQSLKYQRFTPSGFRDIGIRKLGFVAKTQFLYFRKILNQFNQTVLISSLILYFSPRPFNPRRGQLSPVQSSVLENLKLVGTVQDYTEGADQTIIHPLRSLSSESKSDSNIPIMVILLNQILNI